MEENEFASFSYTRHADHFRAYARGGPREERAQTWLRDDTLDAWRRDRFYQIADPFLTAHPGASWLTVGDGRYGSDAHYLASKGAEVMATDISEHLLQEAKEVGYLDDYRKENAEALSFEDESFDFVFCKESYHHFPRPSVALYEMLRVARRAVILLEPNEVTYALNLREFVYRGLRALPRRLRGAALPAEHFEPAGNYLYALSRREVEKVALGLNYEAVAFFGLNDHYIEGVESTPRDAMSWMRMQLLSRVKWRDLLCRLGLRQPDLLTAVLFKRPPAPPLRDLLEGFGYEVRDLPRNPFA